MIFFRASRNDLWASTHLAYSLPDGQAEKLYFFVPCLYINTFNLGWGIEVRKVWSKIAYHSKKKNNFMSKSNDQ